LPQLPVFPSVFPIWWVAGTALAGVLASLLVLWVLRRWTRIAVPSWKDSILAACVVGISILAWRLSGNIPELNDDPIGALSPNDWLCPVVTYVFLGIYAAFRPPADPTGWVRVRAVLTLVSLAVNVITI
jgi:hypothetical protein